MVDQSNAAGLTTSAATVDLGLGNMLQQQVAGETEEQRKKRMLALQQRQMFGSSASPAVMSLFGGMSGNY